MTGQFLSSLDLRLLEQNGRPVLTPDGRSLWAFDEPLVYRDGHGFTITVPVGETTDLASIPRPAWDFLPPDGPWTKAAGVHDFLYKTKGTGAFQGKRWIDKPSGYSRLEADLVLDEAMAALGVPEDKRVIIYEAVRLGGSSGWGT